MQETLSTMCDADFELKTSTSLTINASEVRATRVPPLRRMGMIDPP